MQHTLMQIPLSLLPLIFLVRRVLEDLPLEDFAFEAFWGAALAQRDGVRAEEGGVAVGDLRGVVVEAGAA